MLGCRGNAGLIPVMFFFFGVGLASIGPATSRPPRCSRPWRWRSPGRARIPAFLMAIMVGNGANAGSLSPFAPTGIIVNGLMAKDRDARTRVAELIWTNLTAHVAVAFAGYALFGGLRLFRVSYDCHDRGSRTTPLRPQNWITLGVILSLIVSVIVF